MKLPAWAVGDVDGITTYPVALLGTRGETCHIDDGRLIAAALCGARNNGIREFIGSGRVRVCTSCRRLYAGIRPGTPLGTIIARCLPFAVLVLAGCGTHGATDPDVGVMLKFKNASPEQQTLAYALWEEQKVCTGYRDNAAKTVLIEVHLGGFLCAAAGNPVGVWAAGCTNPGRIEVSGEAHVYENALGHEYIHLIDMLEGKMPDYAHAAPVWARCDWRNR